MKNKFDQIKGINADYSRLFAYYENRLYDRLASSNKKILKILDDLFFGSNKYGINTQVEKGIQNIFDDLNNRVDSINDKEILITDEYLNLIKKRLKFRYRVYLYILYSSIIELLLETRVLQKHDIQKTKLHVLWRIEQVKIMQDIEWAILSYGSEETIRKVEEIINILFTKISRNLPRKLSKVLERRSPKDIFKNKAKQLFLGVNAELASRRLLEERKLRVITPDPVFDVRYAIDFFAVDMKLWRTKISQLDGCLKNISNTKKWRQLCKHKDVLEKDAGTKRWIESMAYIKRASGIDFAEAISLVQVKGFRNKKDIDKVHGITLQGLSSKQLDLDLSKMRSGANYIGGVSGIIKKMSLMLDDFDKISPPKQALGFKVIIIYLLSKDANIINNNLSKIRNRKDLEKAA